MTIAICNTLHGPTCMRGPFPPSWIEATRVGARVGQVVGGDLGLCSVAPGGPLISSLGLMTTAEDDPDRQHESQAEAPAPAAETPTRLGQAAAGMAEAQAWKGQQIAKGWRKLVNALRRREEGKG